MNEQDSLRPPAIFLMGPTASGKTDLAVTLTKTLPCEIISVDSALVYKGMDIGTAKPEPELLAEAPHRLISFLDPSEVYSAADFRKDALKEMAEITSKGRIPLLVGGTMLYFKVLRDGMAQLPAADKIIRDGILADAKQHGWDHLHSKLLDVDPKAAARIKPTDTQRLQRALEVYEATGKSLSEWHEEQQKVEFPYKVINLAVAPNDRAVLHKRIAIRFEQMLDGGFADEVRELFQRNDLNPSLPSIRAVGYRQMWSWLSGELTWEQMVEKGIVATRQLAKRQLTWLRSWPEVNWLDSLAKDLPGDAMAVISRELP